MRLIVKIQQVFVHWIFFYKLGTISTVKKKTNIQHVVACGKINNMCAVLINQTGLIKMLPIMVGEIFPLCI